MRLRLVAEYGAPQKRVSLSAEGNGQMAVWSAGILMYQHRQRELLVLLVHPGGPYWRNKDDGAWSIPKGEFIAGEDPEAAARREFAEELGITATGPLQDLGEVRQTGGKRVRAFGLEGDVDASAIHSNEFEMEWPPRSGRTRTFPEIDRAEWFPLPLARQKILPSQRPFLDRLEQAHLR
jgi:predicted NUDIX family NTP pyrophosphohydrolase